MEACKGMPYDDSAHESLIFQGTTQNPERVDAARIIMDPERIVIAVARLIADATVKSRGTDNRTTGLRTEGNRHHAICHRRTGATR